ncbi:MAG: hypothetical protein O3B06_10865 [Actinobacteria bacterium]|nr:hypothetical protein [Actinomycetota bacterium]
MTSDELPPPPPVWVDPPRRSRAPLVVSLLIALVAAVVVVLVASVMFGDDESGRRSDDVAEAFRRLDDVLEYGDDGYVEMVACPVGDARELAREVSGAVDVDAAVVDGDVFVDAYERFDDYPAIVQCFVTSDPDDGFGPTAVGFSVSAVPSGSYRDFLSSDAYESDIEVTIDVQRRRDGRKFSGDLFGYCYRSDDLSGCGADVVDRGNGVVLSVYLQGSERTAPEVVGALEVVLGDMIEALTRFVDLNPVPETYPDVETDGVGDA